MFIGAGIMKCHGNIDHRRQIHLAPLSKPSPRFGLHFPLESSTRAGQKCALVPHQSDIFASYLGVLVTPYSTYPVQCQHDNPGKGDPAAPPERMIAWIESVVDLA
nr:hypothetical protein CFP56_00823 [Quercus suber]